MAEIYYEKDMNMELLKERKIAVIGYGSQGHAHALNLKDNGFDVRVGLKSSSFSVEKAEEAGLKVSGVAEAVRESDVVMILVPDEAQKDVFEKEVEPGLTEGNLLLFAHGFAVHFGQIVPPENVDVALVAPKSPGHMVRRQFEKGAGVPALVAVHQNYTGKALELSLSYAAGIGSGRSGVLKTTFPEETETDLFGEQAVLCGGVTSLMKAGYETLVEAGYQPEMAYFECINEMKLIVDMIYEGGFAHMRDSISNTAEYGDYITQEKVIGEEAKAGMRAVLKDIQNGTFATNWVMENLTGKIGYTRMKAMEQDHSLETVGGKLREMMTVARSEE